MLARYVVVLVLYHSMVYGGRSLNALLGILMKAVTNSLASLSMARIKLLNIGLLRPVTKSQKLFVIRSLHHFEVDYFYIDHFSQFCGWGKLLSWSNFVIQLVIKNRKKYFFSG